MKLIPTIAVLLTMTLLLTPCAGIAESLPLTEEQVAFYRARTEEWEAAYGPCVGWDYQTRAKFIIVFPETTSIVWTRITLPYPHSQKMWLSPTKRLWTLPTRL